jgi:protein gp37
MNDTEIRWTELTWNPASGCKKITAGCKHCYAETLAENKRGTPAFPNGFDLTIRPHKLNEPYRVREPSLVFVNSMSDLFWEEITDEYRDRVLDVIEDTPQHQYQVLTKRHENMLRYSRRRRLPKNFWAGVTVEDQACAELRIPVLLQVEAAVRFLSIEPALSLIDLGPFLKASPGGLSWVIYGGESGSHLSDPAVAEKRALVRKVDGSWTPREDRAPWPRAVRDACVAAKVPFFFKQWGGPRPTSGGKLLDGKAWEQYPKAAKRGTPATQTQRQTSLFGK